jgi:hypothetical protein
MKLLTFLGTANYSQTTYVLGERRHTTRYCPAAMAHFFQPETTLVVVTRGAQAMHLEALADEIAAITRPLAVPIPDGHRQADLWAMFDALTAHVDVEDELVVDITNGFRSLPFLSFLAVAYLRTVKRVDVRGVYYGAWEARDEDNQSPVFDLTPFVALLDWTVATDRFARFGDARDLASLLRADMPPGLDMRDDLEARRLGNSLRQAAEAMEAVSLALRVTRPLESMQASQRLVETLAEHRSAVESRARPFALLADQIQSAYQGFGLAQPEARPNWRRNLEVQLDMIGWYLDKEQVVQAVTLAREWLVSLLVYRLGGASLTDYEGERGEVEAALNNEVRRHQPNAGGSHFSPYDEGLRALPQHRELGKLWDQVASLRNDLAHAGMRPQPGAASGVLGKAERLYVRLQALGAALLADPP